MNKRKLEALKARVEEDAGKLEALRSRLKKKTAEYTNMQGRHNGQRQVKAFLSSLEKGKYGLTMDEIVDCYWDEILEYMLSVKVRFVPDGPHGGFDERLVAEQRGVFEKELAEHGKNVAGFFDLPRCAIQTILLERGCVKKRVFALKKAADPVADEDGNAE